jgi:hypothetical protein
MTARHAYRKRPCRICRRWFSPNVRLGDRQKTCGSAECRRLWHIKQCAAWNDRHKGYHRSIYLTKKLAQISSSPSPGPAHGRKSAAWPVSPRGRPCTGRYLAAFQDPIPQQLFFIIGYMINVRLRRTPLPGRLKGPKSQKQRAESAKTTPDFRSRCDSLVTY